MERETKELVTTEGNKILYYSYITGREVNAIKEVIFADVKISSTNGQTDKPDIKEYPLKSVVVREREMVKLLTVSLNNDKEKIIDRIQDLKASEYKQIVDVLEPIVAGHF